MSEKLMEFICLMIWAFFGGVLNFLLDDGLLLYLLLVLWVFSWICLQVVFRGSFYRLCVQKMR